MKPPVDIYRRGFIGGLAGALALSHAKPSKAHLPKGHGTVSPPPSGFTVSGNGTGTTYAYAPLVLDTTIHRTVLVAQDADYIDLQAEVAHPGSPVVVIWSIGGADVNLFYSPANGQIAFKAATRGTITPGTTLALSVQATNAHGVSAVYALDVVVPLNADCRFVSFGSGSDANNGTTPALAWKHVPYQFDFTGTLVTLTAGQVLFFKAEPHRTMLTQTNNASADPLPHSGSTGNPFVYCGRGWGGQAALDGSDVVSGWASVTSGEVFNNPNATHIRKITSTWQYYQHLFDDGTMCFPAQWPTPSNLNEFDNPFVDQTGGMWSIPGSGSGDPGGATAIWQTSPTGDVSIRDPRIAARYGNIAVGSMPQQVQLWCPGNNITYCPIATYNFATSTITVTSIPGAIAVIDGNSAYSLVNHPLDIVQAGQYVDFAGERYAWLPNNGTTSVATRIKGANVNNYVRYEGLCGQRYCADGPTLGCVFTCPYSVGVTHEVTVIGCKIYQNRANDGGAMCLNVSGAGMFDSNVTRCFVDQNLIGRFISMSAGSFDTSLVAPTPAQVRAYPNGKLGHNYIAQYGAGRTLFFMFGTQATGIEISWNIAKDVKSVHGNGISIYDLGVVAHETYFLIERNLFDNITRPVTTSIDQEDVARFHTYQDNVFLSYGGNPDGSNLSNAGPALNLFSGEPGSFILRNIAMMGTGSIYAGPGATIYHGRAIVMKHNVISGIDGTTPYSPLTGGTLIYDIESNLITVDDLPPSPIPPNTPPNQINTGTISAFASFRIWDYVISSEMATALGSGPVGPFWNVP